MNLYNYIVSTAVFYLRGLSCNVSLIMYLVHASYFFVLSVLFICTLHDFYNK